MFLTTFLNVPSHPDFPMSFYPAPGILSMSAVLKEAGLETDFIDADVLRLSPRRVVGRMKKRTPDLVGITLNVCQVAHAGDYLRAVREQFPRLPIVAGGPFVTSVGEALFDDFPEVDFAVVKEGEYALRDLVEHLTGARGIDDVRNLILRRDGGFQRNETERITDLDALPLPDYALVRETLGRYSPPYPSIASPSIAVMGSRGCPYECIFCSSPVLWDRKVTRRSVDSVIREIAHLKETIGVREIFLQDDTLNLKASWFSHLCDGIVSCGYHRDIFFKGSFRENRNLLSTEILQKAKEANFWMIFYGVESGNPDMLRTMKKQVEVEEIERAFALTREAGICSFASFMVGNPGESRETVRDTLELITRIRPDFGGVAVATPFPGTELFATAWERKWTSLDNFKEYNFGDCILRTEALSSEEIVALAEEANAHLGKMAISPDDGDCSAFKRTIQKRYSMVGTLRRFGLAGILRRYGLLGSFRKGIRRLLNLFGTTKDAKLAKREGILSQRPQRGPRPEFPGHGI